MTAAATRPRVLLVGAGVAALELLLALRTDAAGQLSITLLSPDAQFAHPR